MNGKWWTEDWWVSEYNYNTEVTKDFHLPEKVEIHDATLRDGEQTPGVVFTKDDKVRIAELLAEIGVDRIEAGMPAVSKDDAEAIREISKRNLGPKIMVFCRAMREDVDRAVDCGADGIVLEAPSGYPKLKYQFASKWTEESLTEAVINTINYAKEKGLYVNYFPFDTTRAELPFLKRLLTNVTAHSKPDSMTVVDTTGSITPMAMRFLVRQIKQTIDLPLEVHTHNDLGLGTATTFAAVEEGVQVVHSCINGLGERTGNTALEEIAIGLKILYGMNMEKFNFKKLGELSKHLERMSGKKLAQNKPVVGVLPFTREIGLGMKVLQDYPTAIFPFLPEFVGQEMKIVMGKKSGKESVIMKLEAVGLQASDEQLQEIVHRTKEAGIAKHDWLEDDEFLEIARRVLGC
ncbi:3-hydroxy-3-methylglutaryl-CoA lyase [Desulfosporosinus fructosivorans]|uniref:3-hydroxy-3-methylglutaryl-CoA lyase n=1 Tax=Desulfosporosinus fructosivorans TaxID=2018669 RepID=A0A4Z0RBV2_9FIRM|nr:3-hydroxy-3-methylglutaryl-CoA lyase [Desulfosporosinus fructosivorans]TGE39106.1 3-hydroxy-3-methylglutaryl-CoA lyase [Desulfosporosinus fructosivorans]